MPEVENYVQDTLEDIWRPLRFYSTSEIACITGKNVRTIGFWIQCGLKTPDRKTILLRSIKDGGNRKVLGKWIIQFLQALNQEN